jgi:UDP:flavonoid glycosyltransferase YjiC (YdhE family)
MSRFLFTTLPSNDLGLLTRSLPIARELKLRGHEVAYCHPARSPQILIGEAGFQNVLPDDPLYQWCGFTPANYVTPADAQRHSIPKSC